MFGGEGVRLDELISFAFSDFKNPTHFPTYVLVENCSLRVM